MSAIEFEHITTDTAVRTYEASAPIFEGLIKEVRGLSKKKPEATMSTGKVKIINRVLEDLLTILKSEPSGKYLDLLNDETLPQMSDAVLTMVQFETALEAFESTYRRYVEGDRYWITSELLSVWKSEDSEYDVDDPEDEDRDED